MLITADWIVPVSGAPIRNGGIVVNGERIAVIGTLEECSTHHASDEHTHFDGCVITPGLVNAHTHLTLTGLAGVIEPQPFAEWLRLMVAAMRPWDISHHEASGVIGAEQCLLAGVTVVGDIAYGAAEVESASSAGLGGVYYWELLGMPVEQIDEMLEYLRYPKSESEYGQRVVSGLSPHSPYTAGPALLQAVHDKARALGAPFALHVAESDAEDELMMSGGGPLAGVASRTAFGFKPPGTRTIPYLDSIGVLEEATAVHACYVTADDIEILARTVKGMVSCPRSNRYLGNPQPAVLPWLDAGVTVGVGTDSAASNADLDIMEEIRAIRDAEPGISDRALLHMATLGGARAIGVDDRFGTLEVGKFADLSVYAVGKTDDPEASVIDEAGAKSARAVMSAGVWRVTDGVLVGADGYAARLMANARKQSLEALEALRAEEASHTD